MSIFPSRPHYITEDELTRRFAAKPKAIYSVSIIAECESDTVYCEIETVFAPASELNEYIDTLARAELVEAANALSFPLSMVFMQTLQNDHIDYRLKPSDLVFEPGRENYEHPIWRYVIAVAIKEV